MKDRLLFEWYGQLTAKRYGINRLGFRVRAPRSRPDMLRLAFMNRLRAFGWRGKTYDAAKKFYRQLRRS